MSNVVTFTTYDDEGVEMTHKLPAKWAVCERCRGKGRHVNPNVDGQGLSREDFDEQGPEFEEDYFAGHYDTTCEACRGLRVVDVVDEAQLTPEQLAEWHEQLDDDANYAAEVAAERRA